MVASGSFRMDRRILVNNNYAIYNEQWILISKKCCREKFGLFSIDFSTKELKRTPKDSARYYARIIRDNGFVKDEDDQFTFNSGQTIRPKLSGLIAWAGLLSGMMVWGLLNRVGKRQFSQYNNNNKFSKHEARKPDFGAGFSLPRPLIISIMFVVVCMVLIRSERKGEYTQQVKLRQRKWYASCKWDYTSPWKPKGQQSKRLKVLHIVRGVGRVVAS